MEIRPFHGAEAATAEIAVKLAVPGARRPIERSPLLQRLADLEA